MRTASPSASHMPLPPAPDGGRREEGAVLHGLRLSATCSYLTRWRPIAVSVLFLATVALALAFPQDARVELIAAVGALAGLTWMGALLVRMGRPASSVALVVTLLDVPLVTLWATQTSSRGEALPALVGPVLVAAWLFGPRLTVVVGTASVSATLLVWFVGGPWASPPQLVPDAAWILLAASALAVALASEVQRALVESTSSLRRTVQEMQGIDAMRRRMVADVSHELRTPLTSINGFLDTVLREDVEFDAASTRAMLTQARLGGSRLEQLVADLLDVERAHRGSLPLDLAPYRASTLVRDAAGRVAPPEGRELQVHVAGGLDEALVLVDHARFCRALRSLACNGFEHGSGTVRIDAQVDSDRLLVDVRDEGPGLPPGAARHAFEPFTTFGEHHGSAGLGLPIARALAAAHQGTVAYVPLAEDGGHAFRLELPLAPATADCPAGPPS